MSMTNKELADTIEATRIAIRATAPDSPYYVDLLAHMKSLLLIQYMRSVAPSNMSMGVLTDGPSFEVKP